LGFEAEIITSASLYRNSTAALDLRLCRARLL
jgi:hypothetical protein